MGAAENALTGQQRTTLAGIAKANGGRPRAYLLKEQLRTIPRWFELARAAGRLDRLGQAVSARAVRQAGQDHQA